MQKKNKSCFCLLSCELCPLFCVAAVLWALWKGPVWTLEEQLRKLPSATPCPRRVACTNVSISFSHSASLILINSAIKLDLSRMPCHLLQWQIRGHEILVQPKRRFKPKKEGSTRPGGEVGLCQFLKVCEWPRRCRVLLHAPCAQPAEWLSFTWRCTRCSSSVLPLFVPLINFFHFLWGRKKRLWRWGEAISF